MRFYKTLNKIGIFSIIMILLSTSNNIAAAQTASNYRKTYLPLVQYNPHNGFTTGAKFLGIYMQHYWTDKDVDTYMPIADALAGKKHSVSAWFINLQNIAFTARQTDNRTNNFYRQLEALWGNGYISFVNIGSGPQTTAYDVTDNCPIPFSSYQVARGDCDRAIQKMADLYHQWTSLGGGRRAFIAPFPEMNGVYSDYKPWTSYGADPGNFKLAYQRIITIFAQRGVTRDQVWWVFAPNGWSMAGHEFEMYYPGDSITDAVAFSSYNYGYCKVALAYPYWVNYDVIYTPYINRIEAMAPNKPIIIGQTGTTAQYSSESDFNASAKNNWLQVNYQYLARQPQVLGVLYYDYDLSSYECNWTITNGSTFKPGYQAAAGYSAWQYINWQTMQAIIP